MIHLDHFIPSVNIQENEVAKKIQELVWASVLNARAYRDTRIQVQPYVSAFPYKSLYVPDSFIQTYSYAKTLTGKRLESIDAPVPYLSDVLDIIHDHGTAEYIAISHPDVFIKPSFYSVIEHYIASGHDAIIVRTSNTYVENLDDVNFSNVERYTWGMHGQGNSYDTFVCKRSLLPAFVTKHAFACLDGTGEVLARNALRISSRLKHLYEDSITCRFNNLNFEELCDFSDYSDKNDYQIDLIKNELSQVEQVQNNSLEYIFDHKIKRDQAKKKIFATEPYEDITLRKVPTTLLGSMWGITTYFNADNSDLIRDNYNKFAEQVRKQGLKLLTVEMLFGDQQSTLSAESCDKLVTINDGDVMWQKERMFNVGVKHLPKNCDKIVFLDADIIFASENWIQKTAALLEEYIFVQPYSHVVRLEKDAEPQPVEAYEVGWHNNQVIHSFGWGVNHYGSRAFNFYPHHGCVGMALAVRRDVIERHGFYDADIIGSGDLLTVDSIFKITNLRTELMNHKFRRHFLRWRRDFYREVRNSLCFIDETIYHLWHGSSTARFYEERYRVLEQAEFDPVLDIALSPQGVWKWSSDKQKIHEGCANYFTIRDDG